MTSNRLAELRSLPIVDYLASLGRLPVKKIGGVSIYHSPLHNTMYPTFCVNTTENRFFDLADSITEGDIFKLVKLLEKVRLSKAINLLETWIPEDTRTGKHNRFVGGSVNRILKDPTRITKSDHIFLEIEDIPEDLTNRYLSRLNFCERLAGSSRSSGIGHSNDRGGFIIYQKYRIWSALPNHITTFANTGSEEVQIFENIFDFLKYLHKNDLQESTRDVIILNFRSNYSQLPAKLKNYKHVDLYLHLDTGGIQLRQIIRRMILNQKQHSYDQ